MRVKDLVLHADSLLEATFMERGTIKRILPNLKTQFIGFHLDKAMEGDTAENLKLQRMDEVTIYEDVYFKRVKNVTIGGAVVKPGKYQRSEHLMLSDLIVLAGGIEENAELTHIQVSRRDTINEKLYSTVYDKILPINYWAALENNDFELQDNDFVEVFPNPKFSHQPFIKLKGEIRYPGSYAIRYKGEKLANIISRAGGFKETAYLEGARFYRLHKDEKIQVQLY